MISSAVIGCGFGDEGKGMAVSYLCSRASSPLVIRFCGGHQAGHHVMLRDGREHVFSNFSSGTLQGAHTYWSSFCTFDPVGISAEYEDLIKLGVKPKLLIDRACPLVTPIEKYLNEVDAMNNNHGTCGVGFGMTVQRELDGFHLLARDLLYPRILEEKLDLLERHYKLGLIDQEFFDCCRKLTSIEGIDIIDHAEGEYDAVIYEGSQGIMLDQFDGFFPHVTRSNTGIRNLPSLSPEVPDEVFAVTRAYQTRHGNGPLTNEDLSYHIDPNPYERNPSEGVQGAFRQAILDVDVLKYAFDCTFRAILDQVTLVVTCLDVIEYRVPTVYRAVINGKTWEYASRDTFFSMLKDELKVKDVMFSNNPYPELTKWEDPRCQKDSLSLRLLKK